MSRAAQHCMGKMDCSNGSGTFDRLGGLFEHIGLIPTQSQMFTVLANTFLTSIKDRNRKAVPPTIHVFFYSKDPSSDFIHVLSLH